MMVLYLNEHDDAQETKRQVEQEGRRCLIMAGDIGDERFCQQAVRRTIDDLGQLHILVNNAAEQHPQARIEDITAEQLERVRPLFDVSTIHSVHAATGNPQRSTLDQNCSHRSGVWLSALRLSTTAAPSSVHFIPAPHSRCLTITLHAASVTPLPIG